MKFDFGQLLEGLETMPDGTACGPNMEYTASFVNLMALSIGQPERQVGDSVLPAREPDWNEVFSKGCGLLATSRDLRVLSITTQAAVHKYGIQGLVLCLNLAKNWVTDYWDSVHPCIELDGEFDPLLRSNAIASFSDTEGVVRQLRKTPFFKTPIGIISFSDLERLVKGFQLDEGVAVRSLEELQRAIAQDISQIQAVAQSVRDGIQSLEQIEGQFRDKLDSEFFPDLSNLKNVLQFVLKIPSPDISESSVNLMLSNDEMNSDENIALNIQVENCEQLVALVDAKDILKQEDAKEIIKLKIDNAISLPNELFSMEDAFKALSLARMYFEKNEPSHPAPIFIKRIEKIKGKDFISIMKELAPEGMNQLQIISGADE